MSRFKYCSLEYLKEVVDNDFVTNQGKDLEQCKESILEELWRKQREKDEKMFKMLDSQ